MKLHDWCKHARLLCKMKGCFFGFGGLKLAFLDTEAEVVAGAVVGFKHELVQMGGVEG